MALKDYGYALNEYTPLSMIYDLGTINSANHDNEYAPPPPPHPSPPPAPTSSMQRDVPPTDPSNDSGRKNSDADGARPGCEGDTGGATAAHPSGRLQPAAWEVGENGPGMGARPTASAASNGARFMLGKPCGTTEAMCGASRAGEGACCARACRNLIGHPCEAGNSARSGCSRNYSRGYQGGASEGETRPFPPWDRTREHQQGDSDGETRPFPHPEGGCTLLRQVDDFLLVTTSKEKAKAFVREMHDKAKTGEWGFSVHEAKVQALFCLLFFLSMSCCWLALGCVVLLAGLRFYVWLLGCAVRVQLGIHGLFLPSLTACSCDTRML